MRLIAYLFGLLGSLLPVCAVWADGTGPVFVDQGPKWNEAARADFYSRDQGSRMIPLAWLKALKQSNGQPFLVDSLARYGYLPNPATSNGLPVGFTESGASGAEIAGMTCSACHTRQITVDGVAYRIDGGPAIVDFQSFLTDLDNAVGQALASAEAFAPFAASVLSSASPSADDVAALQRNVAAWYLRYHTLVKRALPTPSWGPARLDAVGMIFDRLTGLDLGPAPTFIIADNIAFADAPVRYPFLWNAPVQDKTQWPTFADNGNDILALARNLGEVFGVFGIVEPKRDGLVINFLNDNSANFDGLGKLENLIKQIGPPKWPWGIKPELVAQGQEIFNWSTAQGGCKECHQIAPGKVRFPLIQTWATPVQNVGTDTREYDNLARSVQTGSLQGAFIPFVTPPLKANDLAFSVLAVSVVGSIAEHVLTDSGAPATSVLVASAPGVQVQAVPNAPRLELARLPPALRDLEDAFHLPAQPTQGLNFHIQGVPIPRPIVIASPAPPRGAYEARVLQGIWAAAPYLHNGSVPTLTELLKPPADRIPQFKVGAVYDTDNVGLAVEQTQFDYSIVTTDCSALNSGNSRCGHPYGTQLTSPQKKALIEYLKTL